MNIPSLLEVVSWTMQNHSPKHWRTFIIELSQQLFGDYTVEILIFLQFRLWIVQFILQLDELSQLLDQDFIPIQLNALSFADFADVFPIFYM